MKRISLDLPKEMCKISLDLPKEMDRISLDCTGMSGDMQTM